MSSSTDSETRQRGRVKDRLDPSTSHRDITSQSRPANIPEPVIDDDFGDDWTFPEVGNSDTKIRKFLYRVFGDVKVVLEKDKNLEPQLVGDKEFLANVKSKGEWDFINSLKSMAETGVWTSLFKNEVFFKPKPQPKPIIKRVDAQLVEATELAWNSTFQGNAERVLLETIADLLDKKRSPYARLTSIVNSSGTGKSRIVDQLGMTIITVPMCLRPEGSQGFPPPDNNLRRWLVSGESEGAMKRLHGFAYSLLVVTRIALEKIVEQGKDVPPLPDLNDPDIENMSKTEREMHVETLKKRQAWLASTFRNRMTSGQSFGIANKYRIAFYDDVLQLANEFTERSELVSDENNDKGSRQRYLNDNREGVVEAGQKLCGFVDERYLLDSSNGPRWPLIVLAFDEAHVLTDNPPDGNSNLFMMLRGILRQIHKLPIFSLFLSTAGRFNLFSPEIRSDPSDRIKNDNLRPLDPIPEVSFDDIAHPAFEDEVTLDRVVQMDWIARLGRPLFGSRWKVLRVTQGEKENLLMDFAMHKLLDGQGALSNDNRPGLLACLSVRFALEFCMDWAARNVAYTQVERHMRLCVAATTGFEKLVTVAGSEPLLAEAAYELMKGTQMNAVHHLAHHSDLNCIDRGRRGELVAALIIMHARDVARGASSANRRWVTVADFMRALLPPSDYDTLRNSGPTFWRAQEDRSFEETFQGYGMWFNHVIKVEESEMISAPNLWKFVTRGAMILFSNNQEGIDIILPVCDTKRKLSRHSVTAILIQVKNSIRFQKGINKTLFDGMDPLNLGIFPQNPPNAPLTTDIPLIPKPVIRLVFALASHEAGVVFRPRAERRHHPDPFTAFDIWLAGLSASTFRQVGEDLASYQILLERSLRPHDAFELKDDPSIGDKARKLRGPRRQRMAPLAYSGIAHEAIHSPETYAVTPDG